METYWIVIAAALALLIGFAFGYLFANAKRNANVLAGQMSEAAAQVALAEARAKAEALQGASDQSRADLATSQADAAQLRSDLESERVAKERLDAELRSALTQVEQVKVAADQRIAEAKMVTEQRVAETLAAAREQIEAIKADREAMKDAFKSLSEASIEEQTKKAEQAAAERAKRTEEVLAPVKENLNLLKDELGRVQQQRAALDADLKTQVGYVRSTGEALRQQTNALATALRKPQTRGAWGEAQLQNVVEAAGMKDRVDFTTQFTSTNEDGQGVRPDMRVNLGEERFVFVDSKVPMEAFLDALEIEDEAGKREALNRVSKHLKTHIDQLSAKNYFTSGSGAPEFVVLFIPHEAMAAEALYNDATLYEYSFAKNIVLATPTTLLAMLKAIRYSWQQNELAENAQKIAEVAAQLYKRTGDLANHFETLGKNLDRVVVSFNKTVGSFEGSFAPAARRMHALGVGDKTNTLKTPPEVQTPVREPKRAEIVSGSLARPQLPVGSDDYDLDATDVDLEDLDADRLEEETSET